MIASALEGVALGRILADWRRRCPLVPSGPIALVNWPIVHIEALARCVHTSHLQPWQKRLLEVARLLPSTAQSFAEKLGLAAEWAESLFRRLSDSNLVALDANSAWCISELGRVALAGGEFSHSYWERRSFVFRSQVPAFLGTKPMGRPAKESEQESARDALSLLHSCALWPLAHKFRTGFPEDVVEIATVATPSRFDRPWRRIPVVQSRMLSGLIAPVDGNRRALFEFTGDGRSIAATPTLAWHFEAISFQALPELSEKLIEPAWSAWLRAHPSIQNSSVEWKLDAHQLMARVPSEQIDAIRTRSPELLNGEEWLSVGDRSEQWCVPLTVEATPSEAGV